MRILFITPYFSPDYAASSPLYQCWAEDLAAAGHHVTVLTGMPYYGRQRIWKEYEGRFLVKERTSGYEVIRFFTLLPRRNSVVSRILSAALFNVEAFFWCLWRQCDVAFISNPFFHAGLSLHWLARVRRLPVILSIEDIYPEVAARLGQVKRPWLLWVMAALEHSCYRSAQALRVLSESQRRKLIEAGVPDEKVTTIPFFADTTFVQPLCRDNPFREKFSVPVGSFVVMYAGNMGYTAGLETVIEAAAAVRDETNILFLLIGEGTLRAQLQQMAADLRLSNVRFLPYQPREDVPWVLAAADISLVALSGTLVDESVPSKTYWLLASGRPIVVVADGKSEVANLVRESGSGAVVSSAADLAATILRLRGAPEDREQMGKRGRDYVVANRSRPVAARQLVSLLEAVVKH